VCVCVAVCIVSSPSAHFFYYYYFLGNILKFEEADDVDHVHVENPAYDYIPPELVSLFVTN